MKKGKISKNQIRKGVQLKSENADLSLPELFRRLEVVETHADGIHITVRSLIDNKTEGRWYRDFLIQRSYHYI